MSDNSYIDTSYGTSIDALRGDALRERIAQAVNDVREQTPLAQSFTNFVTINLVANAQLAAGGTAAMSFLPDDIIDTAGTICEAVRTLHEAGAKSVTLVATHGLLSGPAVERLRDCGAREIVLTDTVPVPEEKRLPNMTVLSAAPLLAAGIRSVFESGSVSTLLNGLPDDMRPRNIYA